MLRAAALSLIILVMVVVTLPLVDSSAHNGHKPAAVRRSRMNRRHSRAWWRRYRARLRRKRAEQRRLATLQMGGRGRSLNEASAADSHNKSSASIAKISTVSTTKSAAPVVAAPPGWSRRGAASGGETKFVLNGQNGQLLGEATLAFVRSAGAPGEAPLMTARGQRKTLAGVPVSELRRTVIDRMVASGGWVINDLQREINGRQVFIVLARTAASSDGRTPQQSWAFFFAEVDGRIYSLATSSAVEVSDRVADEAAQLMASFLAGRANPVETSLR